MHGLQRPDAIGCRHHAAGADFAGGDHFDVDARRRQGAEHAGCGAGGAGHARPHGAHPGDGHPLLKAGARPLVQQRLQGGAGALQVVAFEAEAHVAAALVALPMGALRLHDRIEADAGVRQGPAHRRGRAGAIGDAPHRHLGLIQVEGHTAHLRFPGTGGGGVEPQLLLPQLEAAGGGLEGLVALVARHQAAHLHLAGGDQPQVDALFGQGVEQPGRHPRAPHDAGPGDAQFGHAGLGAQGGA